MLENLPWRALTTEHAPLAICAPLARKYRADVAPFAGTLDSSAESMRQLAALLEPGETTYLVGEPPPRVSELIYGETYRALQMAPTFPSARSSSATASAYDDQIVRLTNDDAPAMVELTGVAFPGFFRARTCEMGAYFGIRLDGVLIAMGGERLAVPGYRELSGLCTRPGHTGRGYAARLLGHLLKTHAAAGLRSFLHVGQANTRAIDLYRHLGFEISGELDLHPVSLTTPAAS